MSKPTNKTLPQPLKQQSSKSGKGGKKSVLVDDLPIEVVEAVLEDALLAAAADAAAQAATQAEGGGASAELQNVPFLGPSRTRALAAAGILTLFDLHSATQEQIGGVKGVGMRNAERIKEWLAAQEITPTAELPLTSSEFSQAAANQQVQDVFGRIGDATTKIKAILPPKTRDKGLDRQLEKLDSVASELAEGPDTLSAKQVQQALKTLDKIAALLDAAVKPGKLTPKKQAALTEELRSRRKRLEKALDE